MPVARAVPVVAEPVRKPQTVPLEQSISVAAAAVVVVPAVTTAAAQAAQAS